MNAMNDVAEARATALSLRGSAKACTREQGALKFRLMRAADSLDAMVLLAVRGFDRVEQLEQQLAALRSHPAGRSVATVDAPIAPVSVGGVDVAPLATAVNNVGLVESASSDEWAAEDAALRASLRMARVLVQETFADLQAASARGAS